MIDNTLQISELLEFSDTDTFYYLQVLQRKKDNPGMSCQTRQRYFRFIRSKSELSEYISEAKIIADLWNARVYISLSPRSFEKLSYEALVMLAERLKAKDYNSNFKIFEKLALKEECILKSGKLWMFDYDRQERFVSDFLETIPKEYGIQVESLIQTPGGWHIITKPFNLSSLESFRIDSDYNYKFQEGFEVGLKFDCNTLLYYGEK